MAGITQTEGIKFIAVRYLQPHTPSSKDIVSEEDHLEIAIQISIYIQILINSPFYLSYFSKANLNPFSNQTTKGLLLEECFGLPKKIWTPLGSLLINNRNKHPRKIMDILKQSLGLKLISYDKDILSHETVSLWEITRWNEKTLPPYEPKKYHEYIPFNQVMATCNSFVTKKSETLLSSKL